MTLLESVNKFIENITVTDRQEDSIQTSVQSLTEYLMDDDSGLEVNDVFLNGSYERDTIIRPLDDIDLFAVIDFDEYSDNGMFPNPQSVLSKFKNYLNSLACYEGKVKQDRPCVTITLCDKYFDVLPSILKNGALYIPNNALDGWIFTEPKTHTDRLNEVHRRRNYRVKNIVKAVKSWKRYNAEKIPSFHVEEIAINVFNFYDILNSKEGILTWFDRAEGYLSSDKFGSYNQYEIVREKIRSAQTKLHEASSKSDAEAQKIWKEVFGKDFPVLDMHEVKSFSESLKQGALKYSTTSGLSTTAGTAIAASKGFYGKKN